MGNLRLHLRDLKPTLSPMIMATALCTSLAAAAGDGRIPIGTVPYTISAPGGYYLTGDLTNSASNVAITIAANNVNLDLNGHVLTQTYTAACVYSSLHTNIKVSNGTLAGGNVTVDLESASGGVIAIDNVAISGFSNFGVYVTGASYYPAVQITGNRVSFNGGTGSTGIDMAQVWGGRIESNVVVGSGTGSAIGIFISTGDALLIRDNVATWCNQGITLSACDSTEVFKNNVSYDATGLNISGSNNCDFEENLLAHDTTGLEFSPAVAGLVYRNNVAPGSTTKYATTGGTDGGGNL